MSRSQDERFTRATAGVGIAAVSRIGSIAWLASGAISAMVSISNCSSIGRVLSVAFPPILPVTSYPTMWVIVIHVLAGILFAGIAVLMLRLLLSGAASVLDIRRRRMSIFARKGQPINDIFLRNVIRLDLMHSSRTSPAHA